MNNKERLEMIKGMVDAMDGDVKISLFGFKIDSGNVINDFRWLIEQAEQLEKLDSDRLELIIENKRYREKIEEIISSPNMSPFGYRRLAREAPEGDPNENS